MFRAQVTTDVYLQDVFFAVCSVSVLLAVVGLAFIDAGLARSKNVLDSILQKLVAGACCAGGFLFFGFAVWNWQFNQAFGVHNPLSQSISDWWLGGKLFSALPQTINPLAVPGADVLQTFVGFFLVFGFLYGAFFHSVGLERMKPLSLYIMSFVVGLVVWPLNAYLLWGSLSPLTNSGVHDFVGAFSVYIWVGAFALVMAWRLGPRIGAFRTDPLGEAPAPSSMSHVALGVTLFLVGLPLLVLGCGYIVPGTGYFDISMASGGFGRVFDNVLVSFIGGGVVGALIGYRLKNPLWVLYGPITGYIAGTSIFTVVAPWKMLLISLFAPFVSLGTYRLMRKIRIDEGKVVPLALGPGIYGAIVGGFVAWNIRTGGYLGLTGKYGFQHARITPGWQLLGVVVAIGLAVIPALIILGVLQKTIGIRIPEQVERAGFDESYWTAEAPAMVEGRGEASITHPAQV